MIVSFSGNHGSPPRGDRRAPRSPARASDECSHHFFRGSIWLPITPPMAAPPTVPTVLPPVRMAPVAPPTTAPAAVFLSRVDMLPQAASVNTIDAVAKRVIQRLFMAAPG